MMMQPEYGMECQLHTEQIERIDKALDEIKGEIREDIKPDLKEIKRDFKEIFPALAGLGKSVGYLEARANKQDERIDRQDDRIDEIADRMDSLSRSVNLAQWVPAIIAGLATVALAALAYFQVFASVGGH